MKGSIQTLIASLFMGTIGPFIKVIDGGIPIHSLSFFRVFIAALTLLCICPFLDKNTFKVQKQDWKHYIAVGLLTALSLGLFNAANHYTSIANAILIDSTFIFMVPPLAAIFLHEHFKKSHLVGLTIATIGIVIINPASSGNSLGNILAFGSAASFACLVVYMRFIDKNHGLGATMWYMSFAALFLLPMFAVYGPGNAADNIVPLIGIGVLSTATSYLLVNAALEKIESETASLIMYIATPVAAIALGYLFFNETMKPNAYFGGACLLLAGIFVALAPRVHIHHKPRAISAAAH